jgi:adenosylhomocysteinase
MPLLTVLRDRFESERPFDGMVIAACLHVTPETAVLAGALRAGGARVVLAASNPLSTQDDVAAALDDSGVEVRAQAGADRDTSSAHIAAALDSHPDLVVDDGGDLVSTLHESRPDLVAQVRGGCESTASGVLRLRRMAAEAALAFPMLAAGDTPVTRIVGNARGTGQAVIDGILRSAGILLAGKTVVVSGYGPTGEGIAECARGLGAIVIVTEVDPVRALDARLRGFRVLPLESAAAAGDLFITATGSTSVLGEAEFAAMRDGAILANAGHFDVEIDVRALASKAVTIEPSVRPNADSYELSDGRRLTLLADGRVVNLVAAEGNPPEVMDVAFGIEALALGWLAGANLPPGVHEVPAELDAEAARLVLAATGTQIDSLTPEQLAYRDSWRVGS